MPSWDDRTKCRAIYLEVHHLIGPQVFSHTHPSPDTPESELVSFLRLQPSVPSVSHEPGDVSSTLRAQLTTIQLFLFSFSLVTCHSPTPPKSNP